MYVTVPAADLPPGGAWPTHMNINKQPTRLQVQRRRHTHKIHPCPHNVNIFC